MDRSRFSVRLAAILLAALLLSAIGFGSRCLADAIDIAPLLRAINAVGGEGRNHRQAIDSWQRLVQADAEQLPAILAGFEDGNPLATNWLRAAVEAIAERRLSTGGDLPEQELEQFLSETSHAPRARRLAYELLVQVQPSIHQRLIPAMLDDPSLELRRDAVEHALAQAAAIPAAEPQKAIAAYRKTLTAARDLDQVNRAADRLRQLGQEVDLRQHFGFVTHWHLIGPFDHANSGGFDVVYGPEADAEPAAEYPGKEGVVRWVEHMTGDPYGAVDLNVGVGRFKGVIAYARAEFYVSERREVQLRLGSPNGTKIWLNRELLAAHQVYHAGSYMDQYVGKGHLKPGRNVILVKVAQNEQTDSWAQRWEFKLRVCDRYGTAIASQAPD